MSDRTGLAGRYDFRLEYQWEQDPSGLDLPLARALQNQLGLKLETQPGTIDVLVIDHAAKPSAN